MGPMPVQQMEAVVSLAAVTPYLEVAYLFYQPSQGTSSCVIHVHIIPLRSQCAQVLCWGRVRVSVSTTQTEHIPRPGHAAELTGIPSVFYSQVQNYVIS